MISLPPLPQSDPTRRELASISGDIELGSVHLTPSLSPSPHLALLIVPLPLPESRSGTQSPIKKALGISSREESMNMSTTRNPALFSMTLPRSRSLSSDHSSHRERANSHSLSQNSDEIPHTPLPTLQGSEEVGDSTFLDFSLILLTSHSTSLDPGNLEKDGRIGIGEELKLEEQLFYAEGGLHSLFDIYGAPSDFHNEEAQREKGGKVEENECVICLTEKKQIFLLPCRSVETLGHPPHFFRHMCVCRGCFIHIDKCPVCRAPFSTYVMVQDPSPSS